MRVIAGTFRGRRLVAPRGDDTRPTPDRVREALFSALGSVAGLRVLDLYAGTGALGIEALSRGADHASWIESARPALAALRFNLRALDLEQCGEVIPKPVERALPRLTGLFDLVFADPPYARLAAATSALEELIAGSNLAQGWRMVLEHAARDAPPALVGAQLERTRCYGTTAVSSYRALGPG